MKHFPSGLRQSLNQLAVVAPNIFVAARGERAQSRCCERETLLMQCMERVVKVQRMPLTSSKERLRQIIKDHLGGRIAIQREDVFAMTMQPPHCRGSIKMGEPAPFLARRGAMKCRRQLMVINWLRRDDNHNAIGGG
ncbi:hypothetical protein predicted by Glimmer/Critica [Sorangium cellulosum So ce56]|uniref:Uncharacterized protein n=1 Tax=Sorangium cellulosum (strain So ce56) TaxID=448385 RepID=A9F443_SORC5|nr:hypothetical protein predicted by Glimmer/Critica [Sorangium cellulosum So ce56]